MAGQIVSASVKVTNAYQDVLFPSHIKNVGGLLNVGQDKIVNTLIPNATSELVGGVLLSNLYNVTTPSTTSALSQTGAKGLYTLIQNLSSPIDYIGATANLLEGENTTLDKQRIQNELNTFLDSAITNDYPLVTVRAGSAMLMNNTKIAYMETSHGASVNIKGDWLYIYDGTKWSPAINFPPSSVISVAGRTGEVVLSKSDVSLSNVDNKSSATIRSEITSSNVTTALGFTPYDSTNPSAFISGITSSNVTTALGFTPYNSTNPSGFITSSSLPTKATTVQATVVAGNTNDTNFLTPKTGMELVNFFSTLKITTAALPAIASIPDGRIILKYVATV